VDDKLCCANDYAKSSSADKCGNCGGGISGEFLEALGQKWHPHHFVCSYCSISLAGADFIDDNSKPYCSDCHQKLF